MAEGGESDAPAVGDAGVSTRSSIARLVVLVSGNGSNLQAVLDACAPGGPLDGRANVVLVISNASEAYALNRAAEAGVATAVYPHQGRDRSEYDAELAYEARLAGADLVILAGWNRILTDPFLAHHRVINLHPAKPGAFAGLGAIERSFEAWERGEVTSGGVMVHFVPDEGVDSGPVIAWQEVPFHDDDTLVDFEQRIHAMEHRLLVESIGSVLEEETRYE